MTLYAGHLFLHETGRVRLERNEPPSRRNPDDLRNAGGGSKRGRPIVGLTRGVEAEIPAVARKAQEKASLAATPRTKERALATAVLKVEEVAEAAGASDGIEAPHVEQLHREILRVMLDGFLEVARKAEFKGDTKKAVDPYLEALFFLRDDDVDDAG